MDSEIWHPQPGHLCLWFWPPKAEFPTEDLAVQEPLSNTQLVYEIGVHLISWAQHCSAPQHHGWHLSGVTLLPLIKVLWWGAYICHNPLGAHYVLPLSWSLFDDFAVQVDYPAVKRAMLGKELTVHQGTDCGKREPSICLHSVPWFLQAEPEAWPREAREVGERPVLEKFFDLWLHNKVGLADGFQVSHRELAERKRMNFGILALSTGQMLTAPPYQNPPSLLPEPCLS